MRAVPCSSGPGPAVVQPASATANANSRLSSPIFPATKKGRSIDVGPQAGISTEGGRLDHDDKVSLFRKCKRSVNVPAQRCAWREVVLGYAGWATQVLPAYTRGPGLWKACCGGGEKGLWQARFKLFEGKGNLLHQRSSAFRGPHGAVSLQPAAESA